MPRIEEPPRAVQTGLPEIQDGAQPAAQQGVARVPDRLDAIQVLSSWDCLTPILETITGLFSSLVDSCFSCFKGIGIALGLLDSPEAIQRAQEAAQQAAHITQMVNFWVVPYNTRKAQADEQQTLHFARVDRKVSNLAVQLANQAPIRQDDMAPYLEEASQILHTPARERGAQEIERIARQELVKELQITKISELLASKAGTEDPSPYRQEAERHLRAPVGEIENARVQASKAWAEKEAPTSVLPQELLDRAAGIFREREIRRIAREMATDRGGEFAQYLAQAEDQYEGGDLEAPAAFDPSWAGYRMVGDDLSGDLAATQFWADFQALPQAVIDRMKHKVATEAAEEVGGYQISLGLSPALAVEKVIRIHPCELVLAQLQTELRALRGT